MSLEPSHCIRKKISNLQPAQTAQQQQQQQQAVRIKRTQSSHMNPWKQIKSSSEKVNGRYHHSSVLFENYLYVYGGFDNEVGVLKDLKAFNCELYQWDNCGDGPGPRHSHSAVLYEGVMYVFGGKIDRFKSTNAIHAYKIQQKKWQLIDPHSEPSPAPKSHKQKEKDKKMPVPASSQPSNKPGPTDSHQGILVDHKMIICGGFTDNEYTCNIYAFDLKQRTWECLYHLPTPGQETIDGLEEGTSGENRKCPKPRSDFSMVCYNRCLYIFGGKNLQTSFNDFWEFNLDTRQFTEIVVPDSDLEKRSGHSAVVHKQSMLIFGGITSITNERADMICFSFMSKQWGTAWRNNDLREGEKAKQLKLSCINARSSENILKNKFESLPEQPLRKYRRPLAEQKCTNHKKRQMNQTSKHQKQNQRKFLIINQIETPVANHEKGMHEKYSPLIESLTNSIMLTSNGFRNANISSREGYKLGEIVGGNDGAKKKLKARDGHTAHIYGTEMIIFGGDRHMFAINDLVFVNLEYLLENMDLELKIQSQLFPEVEETQ